MALLQNAATAVRKQLRMRVNSAASMPAGRLRPVTDKLLPSQLPHAGYCHPPSRSSTRKRTPGSSSKLERGGQRQPGGSWAMGACACASKHLPAHMVVLLSTFPVTPPLPDYTP